ncbi:CHD5-like protein-domain-containing protein [Dipodascopsis tothii]|uniref:CHD5-like protein-domain-containing protein n=1 Tax=Dipodascopsis tothii TaxID=44089 RepID=UPI0034CF3D54
MATVLVIALATIVFSTVVAAIGRENIAEAIYSLLILVPFLPAAKLNKKARALQLEAITVSTECNNTSPKEEFAKWAKLNRKVEKLKLEIEATYGEIGASKARTIKSLKMVLWVATTGLKVWVRIKFRKEPVFWLPKGWFPGWVEWLLSLTSAPKGCVSVSAWFIIVEYALKSYIEGIVNFIGNFATSRRKAAFNAAAASAKAERAAGEPKEQTVDEPKKEL